MPYARIEFLKDSNGVIVTTGDKSNPSAIEIQFCYPDWAEKLEILQKRSIKALEHFTHVLQSMTPKETIVKIPDKKLNYIG